MRLLKRIFRRKKTELQDLLDNGLVLGKNVRIYTEYAIDSEWPWLISIGDNTMISTNVKILAHDASTSFLGVGTKVAPVDIGKNVFIGSGTIVLCGVKIGDNSIVGAGSVVTKDIPANVVAVGNPCKVHRQITDADREFYYKDRKFDVDDYL